MPESLNRLIDRVLAPVPGWMLLISGMALIAMAVAAPAWIESRELEWQAGLMREQYRRLSEEEQNYERFDRALAEDDPIVLEQLAFYHLRLKPAGADTLTPKPAAGRTGPALVRNGRNQAGTAATRAENPTPARVSAIEELLHTQVPRPGVDYPAYQRPQTRLMRIAGTIKGRLGLLSAGVLCLVAGLLLGVPGENQVATPSSTAVATRTGPSTTPPADPTVGRAADSTDG